MTTPPSSPITPIAPGTSQPSQTTQTTQTTQTSQPTAQASAGTQARVAVVMGSDSDWPVMQAAADALEEFGIPYLVDVVSAHRMPHEMVEFGASAHERGIRVIIAGAGGAAHLPGMLASTTPLPVIGVPVPLKTLDGMDSLLSIVQMPAGVPVATVSIGGARNAGLLAVRMLAAGDTPEAEQLRTRLTEFAAQLRDTAAGKGAALSASLSQDSGRSNYTGAL